MRLRDRRVAASLQWCQAVAAADFGDHLADDLLSRIARLAYEWHGRARQAIAVSGAFMPGLAAACT